MLRTLPIRTFVVALSLAFAAPALLAAPARAETTEKTPEEFEWSFKGPFGHYDRGALQRGFQVYREVCASCHSAKLLTYRNLGEPGGPFEAVQKRDEATGEETVAIGAPGEGAKPILAVENPYVKVIAADYEIDEIDPQTGDTVTRKATPADHFHNPFPNDGAARAANGGALPPDMSVLAKARKHGASYIRSFAIGFTDPPAGLQVPAGKYYNPYMAGDLSSFWKGDPKAVPVGGFTSMPPQLIADKVTYSDGTKATPVQMATDVATFLAWASDLHLEQRNTLGLQVMIFLTLLAVLAYSAYRIVWGKLH
jgi:ubiquinol-cytochrome c reductase cytochrome c1 subunit